MRLIHKKRIYIWIFLLRKEQQLCFFTYRKIYILEQLEDFPVATMQQLLQKMCLIFTSKIRQYDFYLILISPPWSLSSCCYSEMNLCKNLKSWGQRDI